MTDQGLPDTRHRRNRRIGWGAGVLAAGALGGAVLMGALPASAASSTPSAPPSGTSTTAPPAGSAPNGSAPTGNGPAGTPGGQRSDETVLTGTLAAKAKAAALKAVPGGTVIRVETDADGATYEAHMKKADGSLVTVKFDKNMAVTAIQTGMGSMKQQPATSGTA